MKLKNILIVVKDAQKAKQFYREIFGLLPILEREGNIILTEGLVLQEQKVWEDKLEKNCITKNHCFALYFEEKNIKLLIENLSKYYPGIEMVTPLTDCDNGRKMVRFYDPDGNLIEVRTPQVSS